MTPEDPMDSIRSAWHTLDDVEVTPALEHVRRRARSTAARFARRNLREYVAGVVLMAVISADIVRGGFNGLLDVGQVLIVLGIAYVLVYLFRHGRTVPLPEQLGLTDAVTFYRAELVRQRDLLATVWQWYLTPLLPGMLLTLVGRSVQSPALWASVGRTMFGALCVGGFVLYLNRRSAGRVQHAIDGLDALTDGAIAGLQATPDAAWFDRIAIWAMRAVALTSIPFTVANAVLGPSSMAVAATPSPRFLEAFWIGSASVFVGQALWWFWNRGRDQRS